MAKKTTKKLLSIVLSLVLVASSIPFAAFTALADDASEQTALKNQIEAFELKMDGTFYTNMSAAYSAYVTANEKLDIFEATGYNNGMQAAANDLANKMSNMGTFTSRTGTVTGRMQNDDSFVTQDHYNQIYKNLLYSPDCTTHAAQTAQTEYARGTWNVGRAGATWFANYATCVMLYDGKTTPQTAVMATCGAYSGGTWNYNNVRDTAARIDTAASGGLTLPGEWHGLDTRDRNFMYVWFKDGQEKLPLSPVGSQFYSHNGRQTIAYANLMQFTGSFDNGVYSKSVYPKFIYEGSVDTAGSAKTMTAVSNTTPVYIINYKALIDAANTNKSKIILKGASQSYKHGGLASVLRAYETAMAVNPSSYNYSDTATAVSNCANAIKSAVDGLNNATTTADGQGYENLKKALQNTKNDYVLGITDPDIADNYADGAWDTFKNAYEDAGRIFENLVTTGYNNDAAADQLATTLTDAKKALVAVGKVDASALEIAIDNAVAVMNAQKYFTADSYAATNVAAITKAAKEAVWGAEENYGVSAKLPKDSAESQALVKQQADIIRAALMKLVVNKDAVVIACGQSYNSAMVEAQKYLSHADDYSNSSKLQEAVNDASAYANDSSLYLDASIEGHAHFVIETYASGVNGIMFAIQSLNPSFSKITDGTFAQMGTKETTVVNSSHSIDKWKLNFARYNGSIIFKTTHEAKDYDLPDAQFVFMTNEEYDAMLDSVNINADADLASDEITSKTGDDWNLNGEQTKAYAGLLGMSNGGIDLLFHDLKVTSLVGGAGQIGYSKPTTEGDGNTRVAIGQAQMSTYTWDDALTTVEGTVPFSGGITAKKNNSSPYGSTTINAKMTISTKATSSKLFDTERGTGAITGLAGSVKLNSFDTSNSSSYIGMLYAWKYRPFLTYSGYSYDREQYVQQIYVVDISSLLDLIAYAEGLDATQYSNQSWKVLSDALIAAKDEMPYAGMTADAIYQACDVRMQNLFDAIMGLEEPANNLKIKEALDATTNVYRNDETKCEPTTWAAFAKAYQDMMKDFTGKFSDKNVRDYGVSEQEIVDAAAQPLMEAYNNLVRYADFDPVKNAITLLASTITPKAYTASQLDKLVEDVENYSSADWFQFYMANKEAVDAKDASVEAAMHQFYDSKNPAFADSQADILAVANSIYSLKDELVAAELDTSALDAAVANVYDAYKDPDAFDGIDEAVAAIRGMNLYKPYEIFGYTTQVFAFETDDAIDAAVTEILAGEHAVKTQKYDVNLTTTDGSKTTLGTYDYGTKVYVSSNGDITTDENTFDSAPKSDWYYAYKSNTTSNTEKFMGTDTYLAFVVKGNTDLRINNAAQITEMKKVTYVSAIDGKAYKIDYVAPGSTVTPSEYPQFHSYNFTNYTVDGAVISDVVVNEDTKIVANYEIKNDADTYTVILGNMGASVKAGAPITENLKYNDLITCDATQINKIDSKDTAKVSYAINGETKTTTYAKRGTTAALKLTYWVAVDPNYIDAWMAYLNDTASFTTFASVVNKDKALEAPTLFDSVRIIGVGDTLNYRVHEDALIMPLAKQDFDALAPVGTDAFIIGRDEKGASAFAKEELIINDGSFSIVSNYVLPEGATMVETGLLFQSNGDNTDTTMALKFANVGKKADGDKMAVARMKSTQHTAGNQFVITIGSTKLHGDVKVRYSAYVIYEIDGIQYSYVQPTVATSANF